MVTKTIACSPRSPPPLDDLDASLIEATLQDNPRSFGELMKRHQPAIFLMVHRHLRQREEAEDVVSHVFLKAYQHLENFRGESKFSTWLYTIALNLVRNHVRQRKLRKMDSIDKTESTEDGLGVQWPDRSPSTEKIAQDRWDLDLVRTALATISEPHRTIFTLHYFQHLSLNEVAGRIGRPVGTAKVYLHRARKMVLSELQKQEKMSDVTSRSDGVSDPI